jgi:iron complex outermembrane receptor protein
LDLALPDRAVSEEVTFGSRDYGPASFLVGALYYDEKGSSDLIVNMGRHTIGTQEGRALALYGEIYYKITDELKLTAGARYNDELRIYDGGFSLAPTLPVSEARIGEKAFVGWTPRVALSFEPTHDLNFYVNYSEGFKSGAFNPTSLSSVAVKPEDVKSVELGAKASFSKGYVNVAAFHYDYTNMQVVSVVTSGGATASLLQNAAAATGEGIDLDGSFKILEKFRLFGGVSLLDAKYKNFPNAVVSSPNPACGAAPYPCGNVNVVENLSGASLIRAPHFSGTLNAEYTQPLGKLGEIGATATAYNSSTFNWEPTGRVRQGNYSTLAATLEWRPQSRSYSVTVWGRNLTNRAYEVMETDSAGGDLVGYAQPRAFGVRFGFHF